MALSATDPQVVDDERDPDHRWAGRFGHASAGRGR
jgi:hypothetical protein